MKYLYLSALFLGLVVIGVAGYVLHVRAQRKAERQAERKAFHVQALNAVDALARLQERADDGTMWYELAYSEAEREVQKLSHLKSDSSQQTFSEKVQSELDSIQSTRGLKESTDRLAEAEKRAAIVGIKPDVKLIESSFELTRNGSIRNAACIEYLAKQLSSESYGTACPIPATQPTTTPKIAEPVHATQVAKVTLKDHRDDGPKEIEVARTPMPTGLTGKTGCPSLSDGHLEENFQGWQYCNNNGPCLTPEETKSCFR